MLQDLQKRELFIVDDDVTTRDALSAMFMLANYRVRVFADAETFLAAARANAPAGVLLDLTLPGKSGLQALRELNAQQYPAPILIMSGNGDIACAVEAVKSGAFDYMLKSSAAPEIVTRVGNAIAGFKRNALTNGGTGEPLDFPGQALLTPREREVLAQIAAGASNKEAGRRLGISPRTIEVHRARIMEKIGARNAADLVRIVLSGNHAMPPAPAPSNVMVA